MVMGQRPDAAAAKDHARRPQQQEEPSLLTLDLGLPASGTERINSYCFAPFRSHYLVTVASADSQSGLGSESQPLLTACVALDKSL